MPKVGALLFFSTFAISAASALTARAADVQKSAEPPYPAKPIRIISPLASGGSGDALARMVGETLADTLGQPVVIDNRPGANGIIGVDLVAKAGFQ
jgi:tripartite-type tricarboxylate transporter receptor subunit TctC